MKLIRLVLYVLLANFLFINSVYAATLTATPTKYATTMTKFELCTSSTCTTTTVLGSNTATFNIASASAGAEVGSWISSFSLPVGETYSHIRATISTTFTIAGYTTNSDISSDYCVTATSPNTASGHAQGAIVAGSSATTNTDMSWIIPNRANADNGDPYGDLDSTFTTNGISKANAASTFTWIGALTSSYTVTATSSPKITIKFDVTDQLKSSQLGADTCYMWVESPTVGVTLTD